jgi:leucyl aminopeptidase
VSTPALPFLTVTPALPQGVDVLVVGLAESGLQGLPEGVEVAYQRKLGTGVEELAVSVGAKASAGTTRTLPAVDGGPRLVVTGLGEGEPDAEDLRRAAGASTAYLSALAAKGSPLTAAIGFGTTTVDELQAVAEGALLGVYRYAPVSRKPAPAPTLTAVTVLHTGATTTVDGDDVTTVAPAVASAVLTAREWVNIPPNLLYPETLAAEVKALVKDSKVSYEVLDGPALVKGGYGGLLAVGGGSSRPPRLVRLSYKPKGATRHLALVGKGITFDSGGLSLKPGDSMYTMKCDMAGAAAVLAATHAIAKLGLPVQVTAYGALAENLPSDTAYRPSDVLTIYGGTTVENGNSDAEGRLVMADALARANEDHPDLVVDVATLTGACMVALGDRTAGLMATDDETADLVLDAAEAAGEDFWQLPIPRETRAKLDSKVADLKSTGGDRFGGALVAAAFLREFVQAGTPWAHLDIAGPAFLDGKPYGYVSAGGTGVGVRTLIALARAMSR